MRITASFATRTNTREFAKPNEDYVICDEQHGIFMVLDGITRVHAEYADGGSAAADVSRLFAHEVHKHLLEAAPREDELLDAVKAAMAAGNREIARYRRRKPLDVWQFYPGTLGIIAVQCGDKLYVVYAGDCLGAHLRGEEMHLFGEQATLKQVDRLRPTKAQRYELYCNHPENELAYAVFNGDEEAMELIDHTVLSLQAGDTVLLVSDGLAPYVRHTSADVLRRLGCEQMLSASEAFDVPPYAEYADDKSVIRLVCTAG